jgi:uncharacterized protein YecT (DUF1311 family)
MTKDEALHLALEALETELAVDMTNGAEVGEAAEKMCEAITAIKEALAQPEQKSVAMADYMALTEKYVALKAAQRTWVGLTDKERNQLWRDVVKWGDPSHDDVDLMKVIEAKLKEKNT